MGRRLYVGNLPYSAGEAELQELFSRAGNVESVRVMRDAATGRASVGLVELDQKHPFANINLTDNIVRFVTSRYDKNPLVVQGPGAGPAVTAGGGFADLLRVCAYLGSKL